MCRSPVGLGAKRVRTVMVASVFGPDAGGERRFYVLASGSDSQATLLRREAESRPDAGRCRPRELPA